MAFSDTTGPLHIEVRPSPATRVALDEIRALQLDPAFDVRREAFDDLLAHVVPERTNGEFVPASGASGCIGCFEFDLPIVGELLAAARGTGDRDVR